MLWVSKPTPGLAVQVVVAPPRTGDTQPMLPPAPADPPTAKRRGAEQLAVVPPLNPAQVHVKSLGLVVTPPGVPTLQRSIDGALWLGNPFAVPHDPLAGPVATKVAVTVQSATMRPVT